MHLLVNLIFLVNYDRAKDKINHIFIHLNLCIALALGLIVFVAGIETATNNRVSIQCKITTYSKHIIPLLLVCSSINALKRKNSADTVVIFASV